MIFQEAISTRGLVALTCVAIFTFGCGDAGKKSNAEKAQAQLGGQDIVVLEGGQLSTEGGVLSGSGKAAFLTPVADEAASFLITLRLENKGSATLTTYAEGRLVNGVTLKMTREGTKLSVASGSSKGVVDVSKSFTGVDAAGPVSLIVDVHNQERPGAHVLVWDAKGETSEDATIFNSDLDAPLSGFGTGRVWGFELANATLEEASVGAAKFSH